MLTPAVNSPDLTPGWAAEPEWDGYSVQLAVHADRRVLLRSRQDTDMPGSFPRNPDCGPHTAAGGIPAWTTK